MDGGPDNQGSRKRDDEHPPWQQMPMPHGQRMDQQDKGDGAMGGGNQDISEDLMMKVRQHQQLLDLEKKREAQQKLMEQQQLAMLEAQRSEQQQRMLPPGSGQSLAPAGMPTTPSIRSSGVSMVSAPLKPPGIPNQPPPGVVIPPGSMPNQQQQMMQGGPPPMMGQQNPQGGPPGSQSGPPPPPPPHMMGQQNPQGGPPGSQGPPPPPPHMMQGGPPHMGQGGPPRSMNQMGDQDHRQMPPQMGDRPPMPPMGDRPPNMPQMGERPPNMPPMGDRPPNMPPMGDRPPNMPPMGDRPPNMPPDLQQMQQMGDQDLRQKMGDRPPMPPMGDRNIQPMGDQDHRQMSDRPPMQLGGPPMHQGGPMMQQGGPPRPQGGPPMPQGGPPMAQGGPPMSQGPPRPPMPQGGPPMSQGGPQRGPMQQMGDRPPMSQGGSMMAPGGPQISQGGPPMSQGGPHMQQGGSQGGPPMSQGGPPMQQGGPPHMQQRGPPPMSQQSGPLMQQGGPQMSQSGPPGGPPMSQGGRPMGQGGPPMSQSGPPQMSQSSGDRPQLQPPALMSQNMRPMVPGKDGMGVPRGPAPDAGPRPIMARTPYNGPSRPPGPVPVSASAPGPTPSGPRPTGPPVSTGPKEMKLPQALEKMLEFKTQRETEVGAELDQDKEGKDDEQDSDDEKTKKDVKEKDDANEDEEEEEIFEIMSKDQSKESKNKRKKKKKKKARRNRFEQQKKPKKKDKKSKAPEVQVEYVQDQPELDPTDPNYHTFARIFEAFKISEPEKPKEIKEEEEQVKPKEEAPVKVKGILDDDDDDDDDDEMMEEDDDGPKISKKKLKKLTRLTVAQLKQLVTRPDVVEMHDVTARDPRLLVHLKATRNSVPVPRHWCYKRKYLQGKRGIEKTPFELPDFIKATGIEEMRAALQEKEDQKTLKSKMREKVRPKMGKIDIDYQKLHDAFFRFQTKPKMTVHGDLYYEAKEFETKLREKKPGNLTDELKVALGMPVGANSEKVPPPWLIAMQRYGPPPSYPNLKIAGLNGPIPEGCMFGYHAGGWGKPPVDENGKPLYGDVFGTQNAEFKTEIEEDEIDQTVWGELESESESEEESEEEDEEGEDETGLITPAEGLMTPGGITSVPLGMETPDQIELRKRRIEDAMDQGGDTPALYQVLPEKKAAPVGGAMMGSAHVYDVTGVTAPKKPGDKVSTEAVEVSLNPEELDLDTAAMQAKYEQTVREQQSQLEKEDLSDMVAAHAAKQRKRKKAQQDTGKGAKKYKDFKF